MSEEIVPKQEATPPVKSDSQQPTKHDVIRFYSHSQLLYYWPIWLISLIFAAITRFAGQQVLLDLGGTKRHIWIYPSPGLGLAFLIILISVILFTSVNIRGVWAALVAATLVILGLLFSLLHLWKPILKALGGLNFYLNYHFYLTMGVVMLVIWSFVVFVYDRRRYVEYRPTQLTIVEEVGDGEKNFDTMGLVLDKKRDNFFQHWLLGFGSGDMEIKTAGGVNEQIQFHNVLNISHRIEQFHQIREQRGR